MKRNHLAKSKRFSKFWSIPAWVMRTTVKDLSLGMKMEILVLKGNLVPLL